ncbi:MAG: pyridoxamine 5'-phosphate oxidase family protein [Desulfobacterales bacterium]|jgi:hypothetical protein|nr:pyridoxamine 5'-phosphate oxidase family protein [Desulfobacterales bacterium]
MDLKSYFESTKGIGVLSTADAQGQVDSAIYARPHVMEEGTFAFIMLDRLTHANLQTNPRAAYLFIEEGVGYRGKRFFLTKIREEENSELMERLRRRSTPGRSEETKFVGVFRIDKELPLIGAGE